jgi:hypothetical protein
MSAIAHPAIVSRGEWLKRCPNPHDEPGEIEIRPVFSADDFGSEFTPELREQEASVCAQTFGLNGLA